LAEEVKRLKKKMEKKPDKNQQNDWLVRERWNMWRDIPDEESTFSIAQYPLNNSAILDSGTTTHIFNEISRFLRFRPAESSDFVWAGEDKVRIQGYGNVDVEIQTLKGKHILRLFDVAFSGFRSLLTATPSSRILHAPILILFLTTV
jgi:hypothetical protein